MFTSTDTNFPSVFGQQESRIVNGFNTQGPIPYQLSLKYQPKNIFLLNDDKVYFGDLGKNWVESGKNLLLDFSVLNILSDLPPLNRETYTKKLSNFAKLQFVQNVFLTFPACF